MSGENTSIYKYLDRAGLEKVWSKIKENFSTKNELNSINDSLSQDLGEIRGEVDEIKSTLGNSAVSSVDGITIVDNGSGKISTSLGLELNEVAKTIDLVALGNSADENNRLLSSISYSSFVKDGILKSVQLVVVEEPKEGEILAHEPGTYLKFTFNTDASTEDIYVNVSDLVNVYEGSEYITIKDNKTIELNHVILVDSLKGTFISVEDFNTEISSLNELVESNKNLLDTLKNRLDSTDEVVLTNKSNIEGLQEQYDSLSELVSSIDESITTNKSNIESLLEVLTTKANQEDLNALDSRVSSNEEKIQHLEEQIANLGGDSSELTISIEQVTDFEPLNENDIDSICNMVEE